MKRSRKVLSLVFVASLLMSASACGHTSSTSSSQAPSSSSVAKQPATISFMMFQSWKKDAMTKIFEQIKKEENITVDLQVVPDAQMGQLVQTKAAAGELPDLVTQNSSQINVLGAKNFADLSNEPWVDRLSRPETIKNDGKIQMFPLSAYSFVGGVWYNKKVFSSLGIEVPKTYKDFLAALETVKTKGNGIIPMYKSDKDDWTTQSMVAGGISIALYPNQQQTIEKIGSNKLKATDLPEIKAVTNLFLDMYKKGYTNQDHVTATWDMAQESLANGKAAMLINADYLINNIATKWPDKLADIGYFPLPINDKQIATTGKDINCIFVSANSKNLGAAKRFLNAYSQIDKQNAYYAENPSPIPAFKDCNGGKTATVLQEVTKNYIDTNQVTYEYGDMMPSEASSAWWDNMVKNLIAGSTGTKTADKIVSEYQAKLQEVMKANHVSGWE